MKVYNVDDIVRDVRIAIDENYNETHLSIRQDIDTLSLQDIVKDKIEDAARAVILVAPHEMLGEGKSFSNKTETWESGKTGVGIGSVPIPGDFLRLVSFKMSDWRYPVTGYITEDDAEYRILRSRWAGLGGCPERPAVALVHDGNGLRLEFFSCTGGGTVTIKLAQYMPIPAIYKPDVDDTQSDVDDTQSNVDNTQPNVDNTQSDVGDTQSDVGDTQSDVDKIDISERLYRPTVYYAAHLVALAVGNGELAQAMMATCKELLALE